MTKRGKSEMKFETANANEIKFSNAKRAREIGDGESAKTNSGKPEFI